MIKLAANLSMMFQDRAFLDRFAIAAQSGFSGVEYLFPYEAKAETIADRLKDANLTQVIFNTPAGDWAKGERGLAALPDRVAEFREGVELALHYARVTNCKLLHLMAGIVTENFAKAEDAFVDNIAFAAAAAAKDNVTVVIEPINSRVDIPGYFLHGSEQAVQILNRVGLPNARLQFDIYHMQIMEGDLARSIKRLMPYIAHMQLADNPGRHEPGTGEINYAWLLDHISALGYGGWMGCEYRPLGDTVPGLHWAEKYLSKPKTLVRVK